jgi:hypothetical protein
VTFCIHSAVSTTTSSGLSRRETVSTTLSISLSPLSLCFAEFVELLPLADQIFISFPIQL